MVSKCFNVAVISFPFRTSDFSDPSYVRKVGSLVICLIDVIDSPFPSFHHRSLDILTGECKKLRDLLYAMLE